MRGFTKICLWICLGLVCSAILCLGVGSALGSGFREVYAMAQNGELNIGNWHIGPDGYFIGWSKKNSAPAERIDGIVQQQYPEQDVQNLTVKIKYGKINFITGTSDQIDISVDAPKRNTYRCHYKNGTVELIDKTPGYIWNAGISSEDEVNVTISIPEGKIFEEVTMDTNAGTIDITHHLISDSILCTLDAGELTAKQLTVEDDFSVEVGAGRMQVEQFYAESLEIDCGVGEAILCGQISEELYANCGIGKIDIELIGREDDYDYTISCGLGMIHINDKNYSTLSMDKEIDNDADKEIELICGVGNIDLTVKED